MFLNINFILNNLNYSFTEVFYKSIITLAVGLLVLRTTAFLLVLYCLIYFLLKYTLKKLGYYYYYY